MPNLETSYLGFKLRNPLVMSSSPLCESVDSIKAAEDSGASAVVLHSLFEEQIARNSRDYDKNLSRGSESFPESLTYLPEINNIKLGPDEYLEHIRKAKASVSIPVIGSLNGSTNGGWLRYARLMEEAGADALELNIYFIPTDVKFSGQDVEELYLRLVRDVASFVRIPIAVKIGSFFSSIPDIASRFERVGARGIVLFNRFYQPTIDVEKLEVVSSIHLSTSNELAMRIRWVSILSSQVEVDLAVTGGVHTSEDVLKCMMAGAKVSMMTSALIKNGVGHLKNVLGNLTTWMEKHEYESIAQMQGSLSFSNVPKPAEMVRANYIKMLSNPNYV